MKVSNSRLNQFRNCHRAHYYKYVMDIVPKRKGVALERGSIIHKCLEDYYSGKSWKKSWKSFKKDWESKYLLEERIELGDIPEMVYELMEGYIECYEDEDENLDFLEQELHFEVPLIEEVTLEGYIDFIAEDQNNNIWVGETKTHKEFPKADIRLFNMQSSLYVWALEELGLYSPKGIMWNYIKAKTPPKPRILKNGGLSTARLVSTPHMVRKTIKELGLKVENYEGLINSQSYLNFYQRHQVRVNKPVINSVLEDARDTARQILNNPECKDRNLSKNCLFCDYRILCQAELVDPDSDLDFLIKLNFERRDKNNGRKEKNKINRG